MTDTATTTRPLDPRIIFEAVQLATTQGRPTLSVNTRFSNHTVNMEPRGHWPFANSVCFHSTAVPDSVSMPALISQHAGSRYPTSWNGGMGLGGADDFWEFVNVRTHLAWAQGKSSVPALGWGSMECKVYMYSLEVQGPNNGRTPPRAQMEGLVAFMWWAEANLGIPVREWKTRYYTHKGIAPKRKTDPQDYDPYERVAVALGQETHPVVKPPTGIYEVTLTSPGAKTANVRRTPFIQDNIIDKKANGVMLTVVDWEHGETVGGSDWWAVLKSGGYMHISVLTLHIGTPATPRLGTWWVHVSSANANIHSDRSTSKATIIGQIGNRKPVNIVEWQIGENAFGTLWWGRRAEGGWISLSVLNDTPPANTLQRGMNGFIMARGLYLPGTLPDYHVACGIDDEDDSSELELL